MPSSHTRRSLFTITLGLGLSGKAQSQPQQSTQQVASAADALKPGVSLIDLESLAHKSMPPAVFERVNGGAADELTVKWNREAYERIRLRPRVLVDVSKIDTSIKLFGQELPFPILLAPTGGRALIHPEGEIATVRGAGQADATLVISTAASLRVEQIAQAASTLSSRANKVASPPIASPIRRSYASLASLVALQT